MRYILVFQDPRFHGNTSSESESYLIIDTTPASGAPPVIATCVDPSYAQAIVDKLNQ